MPKLCFNIFLTVAFLKYGISFQQNRYDFVIERFQMRQINRDYIKELKIENVKYNRTKRVINMDVEFTKPPMNDIVISIKTYKFISNEYRSFPITLSLDLCEAMANNDYGLGNILEKSNFTACPFRETRYILHNWTPNSSKFPPNIPQGSYRLNLIFHNHNVATIDLDWYGTVQYKNEF